MCRLHPLGALSLLVPVLLGSCRGDPAPPPPAVPSPGPGGTLRFALTEPASLDPARAEDSYEDLVIGQVFEGLVGLDSHLNVVPALAQSWVVDQGGLVYRFRIRDDASFHNGRAVTAEDVAWSFRRAARVPGSVAQVHLAHIAGVPEFEAGRASSISGLVARGAKELTVTLGEPYAPFLETLATTQLRIVPREEVEARGAGFSRRPVGSGPFELEEWRPGERIVLKAYPRHWRERAHLDSVEIDVAPGHDDRAMESFLKGEVDLADFGRADQDRLPAGTEVVERLLMAVTFLGLDLAHPPFDEPRVRRAAALSLDRDAIVTAGGRLAVAARGIVPLGMVGGPPHALAPARDVEEARRLLAEAGHPGGRGLAMADLWANGTSPPTLRAAQVVVADLVSVGIPVRLRSVSWQALVEAIDASRTPAYFMTWVADTPDRDSFLSVLFHSRGASNYLHYSDVVVDGLLADASRRIDPLQRVRLYDEVERRVEQANVLIPLYSEQSAYALRHGLRGVAVDPLGQINLSRVYWEPAP
jgi:ABC-type transport system substrate-binding protein